MLIKYIKSVLFTVAAVMLSIMQTAPAFSQAGNGLGITPLRSELTIEKGSSDTVIISIKNLTKGKITAEAVINDFEADADTGAPKFIIDKSNGVSSGSISSFVTGLHDVELGPEESKDVELTLLIPLNAISGAYYGAVRFKSVPVGSIQKAEVSMNTSVASLVLITVPGSITQKIQVNNVKVYGSDSVSKSLFTKRPAQVGVEVKNLGNGFAKPFGKVQIKNMKGNTVFTYEMNDIAPPANILPGTSRTFRNDIKGVKLPGKYTVEAAISSQNGEISLVSASFWYLPIWFLISVAAIIVAIAAAIYFVYRRYTKKQKSKKQ